MKHVLPLIKTNIVLFQSVFILCIFCLFVGISCYVYIYPSNDINLYHIYAEHFLHGSKSMPVTEPYSLYPKEYPLLSLGIFLLPFLFPLPYLFTFMLLMFASFLCIYLYLFTNVSKREALWFTCFMLLGGGAVLLLRFDIVPSLCIFGMIVSRKKSFVLSYLFLILGVGFKIYPLIFLPFLFVEHGFSQSFKKASKGLLLTLLTLAILLFLQIYLSQSMSVFTYFFSRPIQVESIQSSLLWIGALLTNQPYSLIFTFTSYNLAVKQTLLPLAISTLSLSVLVCGYCYLFSLFLRKKLTFISVCLSVLLLLICTAKVFSPQYLLWVIPLVSLAQLKYLSQRILFLSICMLTTIIYPGLYIYLHNPYIFYVFMGTVFLRNLLLITFSLSYIKQEVNFPFPTKFKRFHKVARQL